MPSVAQVLILGDRSRDDGQPDVMAMPVARDPLEVMLRDDVFLDASRHVYAAGRSVSSS